MSKDTASKPPLWRRLLGQAPEEAGTQPTAAPAGAGRQAPGAPGSQAPEAEAQTPPPAAAPSSWWDRLREGLRRSSSGISTGVTELFTKRKLDAATLEEFEDLLLRADLGIDTSARIVKAIASGRHGRELDAEAVKGILAAELEQLLAPVAKPLVVDQTHRPFVVMMVGVNGSGKTTTIGKLGARLAAQGNTVMLAAGDTFRAAAIEQLRIWGERIGAPVIAREQGADAAGLAFEALTVARQEGRDVLLLDTAGRLQNRAELMGELEKIVRVMRKIDASAPHAVLLVLDATVGQNALSQVEIFQKAAGVTGLVMTKLDGTARGGILVAIAARFGLPIHLIGIGEGVEDLQPFSARDFASALAGIDRA